MILTSFYNSIASLSVKQGGSLLTSMQYLLNCCICFIRASSSFIIHSFIWQPLCPMLGRRPLHASSKLACLALSSARSCPSCICPGRLFTDRLVSVYVFSRRIISGDTRGPSVVFAQDHFIFLTSLIIFMAFVSDSDVDLSVLVCDVDACLVSVQVSAPYFIYFHF